MTKSPQTQLFRPKDNPGEHIGMPVMISPPDSHAQGSDHDPTWEFRDIEPNFGEGYNRGWVAAC